MCADSLRTFSENEILSTIFYNSTKRYTQPLEREHNKTAVFL